MVASPAILLFLTGFVMLVTSTPTSPTFTKHAIASWPSIQHWPGLGFFYRDNDKTALAGLGNARLPSTPVDPQHTQFMLASISKMITFAALTILLDQHKFQLDDDISVALGYQVRNPRWPTTPITYRMLYTHRSSIKDSPDGPYKWDFNNEAYKYTYGPSGTPIGGGTYATGNPICPIGHLEDFFQEWFTGTVRSGVGGKVWWTNAQGPFNTWKPGSKYSYSNMAAALSAVLISKLSGMPFDEFVQTHIFNPLQMFSTGWDFHQLPNGGNDTVFQYFVEFWSGRGSNKLVGARYCFVDYPNGGLWTTPKDLMRFGTAVIQWGYVDSKKPRLWSEATGRMMLSCQDYVFPKSKCSWGLGWILDPVDLYPWLGNGAGYCSMVQGSEICRVPNHDGGEAGVTTWLVLDPNHNVVVGALANGEGAFVEGAVKVLKGLAVQYG